LKEERPTFCEQKVAKKLYDSGSWALARTTPMTQHEQKVFAALISKSAFFLTLPASPLGVVQVLH
jgi:hypothetical protein